MKPINFVFFYLKYLIQTIALKFSLTTYKLISKPINQKEIIIKKLEKRNFSWDGTAYSKVFLVLTINNWEEILVNEFSKHKDTYHFSWPGVSDFFDTKKEWELYYSDLNKRLRTEFDKFYSKKENILIFFYASDFSIASETVEYLKRENTFTVSFCWDDLLYFKGKVKNQPVGISKLSKVVDVNLTLSPEAIPRYNFNQSACFFWGSFNANLNPQTMPMPIPDKQENEFYVLFIGSKYGWREGFINKLKKAGIKVICYGRGWNNDQLSNLEVKVKIMKAPLTLGFSNVGYTKNITTIKGRDFEVPLWGGLYLTQYSRGLMYYYESGKEILTYKSVEDCIRKINYIKTNPIIAIKIRKAGYERALNFSGWESRLNYLDKLIEELTSV